MHAYDQNAVQLKKDLLNCLKLKVISVTIESFAFDK